MKIKCPHCSGNFELQVTSKSAYNRDEKYVIKSFFEYLKGIMPLDGYFEKLNYHEYKFYIQVEGSPDGDVWMRGIIEWTPGIKLEVKNSEYTR